MLEAGDVFPECVSCLQSQKDVDIESVSNEGTWEKLD